MGKISGNTWTDETSQPAIMQLLKLSSTAGLFELIWNPREVLASVTAGVGHLRHQPFLMAQVEIMVHDLVAEVQQG